MAILDTFASLLTSGSAIQDPSAALAAGVMLGAAASNTVNKNNTSSSTNKNTSSSTNKNTTSNSSAKNPLADALNTKLPDVVSGLLGAANVNKATNGAASSSTKKNNETSSNNNTILSAITNAFTAPQDPAGALGAAIGNAIGNAIVNNKDTNTSNNNGTLKELLSTGLGTSPNYATAVGGVQIGIQLGNAIVDAVTKDDNNAILSAITGAVTAPQDPAAAAGAALGGLIADAITKGDKNTSTSGSSNSSTVAINKDDGNPFTDAIKKPGAAYFLEKDPIFVMNKNKKEAPVGSGIVPDPVPGTPGITDEGKALIAGDTSTVTDAYNVVNKNNDVNNSSSNTGSSNNSSSNTGSTNTTTGTNNNNVSVTPVPTVSYPTAEEMASYVSTILQAAKGELGEVVKPEYMDAKAPDAPALRTLEDLAKTYGITYDYNSIYKILNDSVEKQYDAIYAKQKQNEDAYYDNASAAQNTLLDTLSRDRSNAVQAGVSKGMQAANALGAMLGVSQQFANNATALSQERSNTAKSYGADLAKAVVNAEATSNERKNAIMEIAKMLYGYDSEQYVANMDNYNTILTNNAALQQSYMNNKTNLQNALASIFGGVANNSIIGNSNVQSSLLTSEAQKLAAQYAANAQKYAADQSLAATTYNADINKVIAQLQQNAFNNEEVPTTGTTNTGSPGSTSNTGSTINTDLKNNKKFPTIIL